MFGDVWRAGFSIDEMLRADVQISVGFDSPKFRSVEHGAGPARHRRLMATRIDDTVVQLMFPPVSKPWKGPLPKPRKSPKLCLWMSWLGIIEPRGFLKKSLNLTSSLR